MKYILILIFNILFLFSGYSQNSYFDTTTKCSVGLGFGGWNYNAGLNMDITLLGISYNGCISFTNKPYRSDYIADKYIGIGNSLQSPNICNHLFGYEFPIYKTKDGVIKLTPMSGFGTKTWYFEGYDNNHLRVCKKEYFYTYGLKASYHFNEPFFISMIGMKDGVAFAIGISFNKTN